MNISIQELLDARNASATEMLKEASAKKTLLGVSKGIIDDMVGLFKGRSSATKGMHDLLPQQMSLHPNLQRELDVAYDLGTASQQVRNLNQKADLGKTSLRNSYSDLFNTSSDSNPLQLYRQARSKAYQPLGDEFANAGSSLKEVANNEMKHLVVKSLGQQADNPEVLKYAKKLVDEDTGAFSDLTHLAKKVRRDFEEGVDATFTVPNAMGNGTGLTVKVDRPLATYNGSPAFDLQKTFGIRNADSFNKQHQAIAQNYDDAARVHLANRRDTKALQEFTTAKKDLELSAHFRDTFGRKITDTTAKTNINTPKVTLADFKTLKDVEAFFKNPLASNGVSALPKGQTSMLADDLVDFVKQEIVSKGNSPQVIKNAIITKLDKFAQNPLQAGFLDTFHFARYSADEMKDVIGALKGTSNVVSTEYLRLGADALALGLGGGLAGLGITTMLDR